jgi:hypothetical protein
LLRLSPISFLSNANSTKRESNIMLLTQAFPTTKRESNIMLLTEAFPTTKRESNMMLLTQAFPATKRESNNATNASFTNYET